MICDVEFETRRMAIKASMILMLTLTAVSLLRTADNMAIPCSVKTYGIYFRCCPCRLFKVTICDLKLEP